MGIVSDAALRTAAFDRLRLLTQQYGGAIPWSAIQEGFKFGGETVLLAGRARGIFKPRRLGRGALSVKTTTPREGRTRRYKDLPTSEGHIVYRFMGDNPKARDNQWLLENAEDQTPLIYFVGVSPTFYEAVFPVFVTHWDAAKLCAHVSPGIEVEAAPEAAASQDLRHYRVAEVRQRLHQSWFREAVLGAYGGRCALSGLPERRLLEAAHILPDTHTKGIPVVTNGIAMTALHHAAYDGNLLGIDADGVIHIRRDLLEAHDGPTLKHSLQGLHRARMRLPFHREDQPDRDFLAERFELFLKAA